MRDGLHVELFETGGAEGVSAVDHDAGDVIDGVIGFLTKRTIVLVE